jgi:hypothetical protein
MAKWADSSNNFQGTFTQFAAQQGLTMGQQVVTTSKPHANSLHERAVNMLAEETRSGKTQTGAVVDGPPNRVGPVDEQVLQRDPQHPTLGRIPEGRETLKFGTRKDQDYDIVHYHSRGGPDGRPTAEHDIQMLKDNPKASMYFSNKDWARQGNYEILRYGAKPEWQKDPRIIPSEY